MRTVNVEMKTEKNNMNHRRSKKTDVTICTKKLSPSKILKKKIILMKVRITIRHYKATIDIYLSYKKLIGK